MRRFAVSVISVLFILFLTINASAAEPQHYFATSEYHACYVENGKRVTNRWVQDDKCNWYYADKNGDLLKNTWFQDTDGKWYYFSKWAMLHDTTTPDGYYVGSDGAWDGGEKGATAVQPKSPGEAIEQKKAVQADTATE